MIGMLAEGSQAFATSISGQIIIPAMATAVAAAIVAGFVWFAKTSKRLTTQDLALAQILNVISPAGQPSLVETLTRIQVEMEQQKATAEKVERKLDARQAAEQVQRWGH